jgi:hypothetical protein
MDMMNDYRRILLLMLSMFLVSLLMLHRHRMLVMVLNKFQIDEIEYKNLQDLYEN